MFYFIINPKAGSGKGENVKGVISSFLVDKNISYEIYETEYAGHAVTLAAELSLRNNCEALIAAGGDGTFYEVLNGMDLSVPLGLIPCGTGNDFACGAGISLDVKTALSDIVSGEAVYSDFITVNDVRCLNAAGVGIDIEVLKKERRLRKHFKGKISYLLALMSTLLFSRYKKLHIIIDDSIKIDTKFLLFTAANGCIYGGGLPIALSAKQDDGLINAVLIKNVPKIFLPWLFIRFMRGKLETVKKYVEIHKCKKIDCLVEGEREMQLDGEIGNYIPAVLKINEKRLRIIRRIKGEPA